MTLRQLTLALLFCLGCQCRPSPTAGLDGPADTLSSVFDAYQEAPVRGSVPPQVRASQVLVAAGEACCRAGAQVEASLRRHASEVWAGRLSLMVDHGGTAQLAMAWSDLVDTATGAVHVPAKVKLQLRAAQGRVNADRSLGRDENWMRARFLSEIAWAVALLGEPDGVSGP